MLEIVRDCRNGKIGEQFTDTGDYGFMLKKGEFAVAFLQVGYLENVREPTRYSGGYGGVSFPIFGKVRLNTGKTGGKITKGAESINTTDQGPLLITNQRIMFAGTKRSRARALRPYAERLITFAKKAAQSSDKAVKLHYYRLAIAKLRDEDAAQLLFKTRAPEFLARNGGYTRIYKLGARKGDAAEQALIELVAKDDKTPAMTPKAKAAKQPKAKKEAAAAQA